MDKYVWVVCLKGKGREVVNGKEDAYETNFAANAVGILESEHDTGCVVWLIGTDSRWRVDSKNVNKIDVARTGDKFPHKICNVCHCLKPIEQFDKNQNNLHGVVRRPSCKKCRTDIDKRPPKTQQAKDMEKTKPSKGTPFKCPICRKRSIVGITAKIVADHDHHTGNVRGFICDSCNTGLGRFKNGENYLMNAVNYIKEKDSLTH
jgi:hypothetical protein